MNSSTHPIAQPPTDGGQNYQNAAAAVSLGLLLVALYFRFYISRRKVLRLPPGPRGLPIIGNLHQIGHLPHHTMTQLSKEYGEILSLKLGSKLAIVVSSPETAREVLKTQDQIFASRPHTTTGVVRCHNRQNIVWAPYGPTWRFLRRICLLELFTVKRIGQFQNVRREEIMNFLQSVLEAGSTGDGLVQIDGKLSELSTNNITRMVFNKIYFGPKCPRTQFGEVEEFQTLVRDSFRTAGSTIVGDVIPFLQKLDLGGHVAKTWELRRKFDAFFGTVIDEHRQKSKTNPDPHTDPEDFVDVLLSVGEDNGGNKISDEVVISVLGDMLLGGTETSANQICWALTELMRHPEIRSRVQLELDKVVGQDRLVEEWDLPQLKYLDAVVKESFRLHPVGPLLVPHESVADTKIAGYDIPAQTRVFVNVYAIQRDPRVWENPLSFDPERFLSDSCSKSLRGQDFDFLPFGSGRRICPGINLALIFVQLTLAQMLHTCELSLPPGTTPEQVSVEESFGLSAPRAHPLELLVRPRLPRWSELQGPAQ